MPSEGRRSKMKICVDILRLIQRKGGIVKPTHILYGANLSHKRMIMYLDFLLRQGFIEEGNFGGHRAYRLTKKGREFILEFKKFEEMTEAFGISL